VAQQEKYLIDLKADRRKGSRRVADGVVASHRVLEPSSSAAESCWQTPTTHNG